MMSVIVISPQLLFCDRCFCHTGGIICRPQWTFSWSRSFFHPRVVLVWPQGKAEGGVLVGGVGGSQKGQCIHLIGCAASSVGQCGGHKNRRQYIQLKAIWLLVRVSSSSYVWIVITFDGIKGFPVDDLLWKLIFECLTVKASGPWMRLWSSDERGWNHILNVTPEWLLWSIFECV